MAQKSSTNRTLNRWYRNRIGEPATNDEARGYWIFAAGALLGILGILLFLGSRPAGGIRQWSIILAASGFVLLLAGPIIRLPLRRTATWLVYLGVIICAVSIAWFYVAFPQQWSPTSGQPTIIGLYTLGLLVMAVGGVFVPVLTPGRELEAELQARQTELVDARADLADTQADEADLAGQLRALRRSQARFELYEDSSGKWRWRLRHRNGNVIADSGQGYTQRHNAQNGLESVRRNALGATLLLFEAEEDLPAVDTEFEPVAEAESRATFESYEDSSGEFRWRLVHDNGNILADGAEGYSSIRGARSAADNVRGYVGPADYLRPNPTAFEVYRDRAGEFRWRLVHENGNIVADGGQGYTRRHDASRTVNRLRSSLDDFEFEVYEDQAGEFRWRLRAANNELVADSGEGYESREGAQDAVERMQRFVPEADVLDIGLAAFEGYEDTGGEFRWRLRHRNGSILADSGEGYADRSGMWDAIESVKRNAPNAEVAT